MIVLMLVGLGLILGSFVNAFVWRLHAGKDWVRGRSECPHCHHVLAPKDLVPVLSWLSLGGNCRYCGKPIPDSPIIELLLPVLYVGSYIFWPEVLAGSAWFAFVLWLVFLVGFLALAVYDFKWFLLPDVVVFPLIGLALFQVFGSWLVFDGSWHNALGSLLGAAAMSGLFWVVFETSKGKWIGFGDVKLAIVLGSLAGGVVPALLILFIASVLGVLLIMPMVFRGKANRKSHVPFGPLLIAGTIVVVLFGSAIVDWYARLLVV